jgi:hypothetical protein
MTGRAGFYVTRFLIGACESGFIPGAVNLVSHFCEYECDKELPSLDAHFVGCSFQTDTSKEMAVSSACMDLRQPERSCSFSPLCLTDSSLLLLEHSERGSSLFGVACSGYPSDEGCGWTSRMVLALRKHALPFNETPASMLTHRIYSRSSRVP